MLTGLSSATKQPTLFKATLSVAGAALLVEGEYEPVAKEIERFYAFASEQLRRQTEMAVLASAHVTQGPAQ